MMASGDVNLCESEGLGETGKMQQWYQKPTVADNIGFGAMKHILEHLKIFEGNFEMKGSPYFK